MSIYAHVPFCVQVCPYCDFCKTTDTTGQRISAYLDALATEIADRQFLMPRPKTLYLGGGTPSRLNSAQLERLFGLFRDNFDLSALQEWTMEIDPATSTRDKLTLIKQAGVTRASVGVQSFDDAVLKDLGRLHRQQDALSLIHDLAELGFDDISLDLIIGLPQGEAIQHAINTVATLPVNHVSLYILSIESGTPFAEAHSQGTLAIPDDDDVADHYRMLNTALQSQGFEQYEISNWAKPGHRSEHNLGYWQYQPYLGLGPGATSFDGQSRRTNTQDIDAYAQHCHHGHVVEPLDPGTQLREKIMLGLRQRQGLPTATLSTPELREIAETLKKEGLLEQKGDNLRLPEAYLPVSNAILERFF